MLILLFWYILCVVMIYMYMQSRSCQFYSEDWIFIIYVEDIFMTGIFIVTWSAQICSFWLNDTWQCILWALLFNVLALFVNVYTSCLNSGTELNAPWVCGILPCGGSSVKILESNTQFYDAYYLLISVFNILPLAISVHWTVSLIQWQVTRSGDTTD